MARRHLEKMVEVSSLKTRGGHKRSSGDTDSRKKKRWSFAHTAHCFLCFGKAAGGQTAPDA